VGVPLHADLTNVAELFVVGSFPEG
jgi:hypothetical protein